MTDDFAAAREREIESNQILLYAKGDKGAPMCGYSARVMEIFDEIGKPYEVINILENPDIRARLKEVTGWPTFPQVFIGGKLIGGCDIALEMYESGDLAKLVQEAFSAQA